MAKRGGKGMDNIRNAASRRTRKKNENKDVLRRGVELGQLENGIDSDTPRV